uniref:(northern house mosquito) hypothetical protein n=1 Tax=Culex pipiens TaxID=7175 RepID=A0A8D8IAU4_CULPI
MDKPKLLSACTHGETLLPALLCVSEICVMKSHFLCVVACQLELNLRLTLFPSLTFSHTVVVLFTIFVFTSLFYLLTLYNILLFFIFFFLSFSISLVFTTYYLFLRNQIELFLLYFFSSG